MSATPRSIVDATLRVRSYIVLATAAVAISTIAIPSEAVAQVSGTATIREAVVAGDTARVAALLDADPVLVQSRDPYGKSLLGWAANRGDEPMVRLLLSRGTAVDVPDNSGHTPLAYATAGNDRATVNLLLDAGADVNFEAPSGQTVLLFALMYGSETIVDLVLDRGARLPAAPSRLSQMISLSESRGLRRPFELAVVEAERRGMPWADPAGLFQAARGGSVAIGERLLDAGADVNATEVHGSTPLEIAAESGHVAFVEWLVERGASLDAATPSGMRAVDFARAAGHDDVANRLLALGASPAPRVFPELRGPYMGQPEPTDGPARFAPGIASLNLRYPQHSPVVVSPDGTEMFWGLPYQQPPQYSRLVGGRWTAREPAPFNSSYTDGEAFFSPDGQRVYFLSSRPLTPGGAANREHVWYVDREGDGWSEAYPASAALNAYSHHWLFSVSLDETLYFASATEEGMGDQDIYRSRLVDGAHQAPEHLGPVVNTTGTDFTPFIAPDESYLIFSSNGHTDDGQLHLFISYRSEDGGWLLPQVLDSVVRPYTYAICPAVTPDGRFMFFVADGDIWWVKADFIDAMRPARAPEGGSTR